MTKRSKDAEEVVGRWECDSKTGGKFWSISRDGCTVTTTWGKLGTSGQSNSKDFESEEKAIKHVITTVAKKEKEGYAKTGGGDSKKEKLDDDDDVGGSDFDQVFPSSDADKAAFQKKMDEVFSKENRKLFTSVPLTDDIIRSVQKHLQVRLPASYLHFCRILNGAFFLPHIVGWLGGGNVELQGVCCIAQKGDRTTSDSLVVHYENSHEEWEAPKWLIPLGGDGHGWVCFDYRKAAARKSGTNVPIVSIYQDDDWEPVKVAPDFESFLEYMKNNKEPGEEEEEEDNEDDDEE